MAAAPPGPGRRRPGGRERPLTAGDRARPGPAPVEGEPLDRRTERLALLAIVALAVAVRLAHFLAIAATPFPRFNLLFDQSDMHTYWHWAQGILAGDLLGRQTYHPSFDWMREIAPEATWHRWWGGREIFQQAPLYPYLLALLLALVRGSLVLVLLAQLVAGGLACAVYHALGRRVFGPRVGLAAAALGALYGPFVFHQGALLRDWLPPILEPLALVALLRAARSGRPRDAGLAGLALGVAGLARETALGFVPLALGWLVVGLRATPRRAAGTALALLAGLAVALAPLVARNVAVGAPPLALSNRLAEGVIEGHAADGYAIGLKHPPSMRGILERSGGRLAAVVRETLATWQGDWWGLAGIQLLKLRALADPIEIPNNLNIGYGLEISPPLRALLRWGALLPLGLAGLLLAGRPDAPQALLWMHGLATVATLLASIVFGRFRLALVPVLLVYGGVAVVRVARLAAGRRWGRVAAVLGLLAAIAAVQQWVAPIPALRDREGIAIHRTEYLLAAEAHARDGQHALALRQIERLRALAASRPAFEALRRDVWMHEGDVRIEWAGALLRQGRREEARRQAALAGAAYARGPAQAHVWFNLGLFHVLAGDRALASRHLEEFLRLEPEGERATQARRLLGAPGR